MPVQRIPGAIQGHTRKRYSTLQFWRVSPVRISTKVSISCVSSAASIPACPAPRIFMWMEQIAWFRGKLTLVPVASRTKVKRIFIGGVGYTNLRDLSIGPVVVPQLQRLEWPAEVEIDDLSLGGPIAAVHRFREAAPYNRVVLLGSVGRARPSGRIYCYRWDGHLPDREEIQMRVAEAVTGVISLDNLLIVGGFFGIWTTDVVVVEIEPCDENWGPEFSEPVQAAIVPLIKAVRWAAQASLQDLSTSPEAIWKT